MNVLSVAGLSKHYPGFSLGNVGFTVEQGEIMGFIGRNGAGKTTTLKLLLNIVHPDAGEVSFFGLPFQEHELEIKRRIGFVSGGVDYYIHKKLRLISSVARSFYPNWDEASYQGYLSAFGLDEHKTPAQLSAGMKVKYNLAIALSHHAELLILDEPTSGLDPVSRDDLLDVFIGLAKEGVSILFSTHITSDLDKCADRITFIHNGLILASESLAAYVGRYRSLALSEDQLTDAVRSKLIGLKPAKRGYTAIAMEKDAKSIGLSSAPADLETVMVHMEKELGK
ncbi:MAG: ABC transporter ATP-binding protein [Eubacteriales bacterium]|nr:ABC transporter ATP-binding protein [Eubacteriales bacterium]